MAINGPRPEYNQPKQLRQAVDKYFAACEEAGIFPDFAGMKTELRLTDKDIERLLNKDNPDVEAYQYIFECARDRRESWLTRRMVAEPKAANGCMNALKQEKNGGYMDKSTDKQQQPIKIEISGVGGMSAFD